MCMYAFADSCILYSHGAYQGKPMNMGVYQGKPMYLCGGKDAGKGSVNGPWFVDLCLGESDQT